MSGAAPGAPAATPLWQRLGITPGCTLALVGAPEGFAIPDLPDGVRLLDRASEPLDVVIFFTSREATLQGRMPLLVPWLAPAGGLWIAWPSESERETDLDDEVVRSIGRAAGLADDRSAALDGTWMGVRLVRKAPSG